MSVMFLQNRFRGHKDIVYSIMNVLRAAEDFIEKTRFE